MKLFLMRSKIPPYNQIKFSFIDTDVQSQCLFMDILTVKKCKWFACMQEVVGVLFFASAGLLSG